MASGTAISAEDVDALFLPGFVRALKALGRALRARRAARTERRRGAAPRRRGPGRSRTARRGRAAEPSWAGELVPPESTAALLVHDEAFDDGVSVVDEFGSHTLGVYVDHNAGGVVKDAFVAGPLAEVRETLAAARTRDRRASWTSGRRVLASRGRSDDLDHTLYPPVSEESLAARARRGPDAAAAPGVDLPDRTARSRPRSASRCSSDSSRPRRASAGTTMRSARTSPLGDRLRRRLQPRRAAALEPGRRRVFMSTGSPARSGASPGCSSASPTCCRDWVRYAARRRGVPGGRVREAVDAVADLRGRDARDGRRPGPGAPRRCSPSPRSGPGWTSERYRAGRGVHRALQRRAGELKRDRSVEVQAFEGGTRWPARAARPASAARGAGAEAASELVVAHRVEEAERRTGGWIQSTAGASELIRYEAAATPEVTPRAGPRVPLLEPTSDAGARSRWRAG